jgi:putative ABC transport system ATP-binding protein
MNGSLAQMYSVSKTFNRSGTKTDALHNVSFQANAGELTLLLGPSGSGKTTFLTLLAGLQKPTEGTITIFGKNVKDYSSRELQILRSRHIGFIFQTFYLLDSLTSLENVMLVMKFAGISKNESRVRAEEFLDRFGVKHLGKAYPKTLSQGEKQRVAVARALANGAELILADEPTGSLATQQGMTIVHFLKEAAKTENRCVIIASHDERIKTFADRVLHLSDGEII